MPEGPDGPSPARELGRSVIFTLAIVRCAKWYLMVVFTKGSLTTNGAECFFLCPFAVPMYMHFLVKCQNLCSFLNWVVSLLLILKNDLFSL